MTSGDCNGAIWGEGYAEDTASMPLKNSKALTRFNIPDAQRFIVASRDGLSAVGRYADTEDAARVPLEAVEALATRQIPHAQGFRPNYPTQRRSHLGRGLRC